MIDLRKEFSLMIDIQTMLNESMRSQNEIFGPSARVHNYYASDSIRKPIRSREMYRGAGHFGHHTRVRGQMSQKTMQPETAPVPAPAPAPQRREKLDDFYFYFTYVENGRTYVVFKKHVFLILILAISIGIGVLALDVRRLFLFLAKGLQASLASIIS